MEIEILSEEANPMLHRTDVRFEVVHNEATPGRLSVRDSLAARLNKDAEEVVVHKLDTKYGMRRTVGYAKVYDTPTDAQDVEQEYMLARNKIGDAGETEEPEADAEAAAEPEVDAEEADEDEAEAEPEVDAEEADEDEAEAEPEVDAEEADEDEAEAEQEADAEEADEDEAETEADEEEAETADEEETTTDEDEGAEA